MYPPRIADFKTNFHRDGLFWRIISAILLCLLCSCSTTETIIFFNGIIIRDDLYHFQFQIPDTWSVSRANNITSEMRVNATGKNGNELVVYAIHSNGMLDLEKLSDHSIKFLKIVGKLESTKYYPDYFFVSRRDSTRIVKSFKEGALITLISTEVQGPYGYIMVFKGSDEEEFRKIVSSFKVAVPWKEMTYAQVHFLIVFILACFLGTSGFSFRKKIIALRTIKMIALKEGLTAKLIRQRKKIILRLLLAPVWCTFLYLFGIFFLEYDTRLIFIIMGPILPILGYFGFIRKPPDTV